MGTFHAEPRRWLNQRVTLRAPGADGGWQRGWVIQVQRDRRLLVLWDDSGQTSVVAADDLVADGAPPG